MKKFKKTKSSKKTSKARSAKKFSLLSKKAKISKIGILASGGNSQGMNNAVITLIKKSLATGVTPYLIYDGYKGLLERNFAPVDPKRLHELENYNSRGNVFIGSARSADFYKPAVKKVAAKILKDAGIDVLFAIGGDGTFKGAAGLHQYGKTNVICLPGTIDNDVSSSEQTIGFFTCINNIVRALDALRDSFDSHSGICFCEVMGRGFSDLAIYAGVAVDAEAIVTKDNIKTKEEFLEIANKTKENGKRSCLFVVTESLYGKDGLPSLADIAKYVGQKTDRTTRVSIIGHVQRGGTTDAWDRANASLMAIHGFNCALNGKFNKVISMVKGQIVDIDVMKATNMPRKKNKMDILAEYKDLGLI